MGFVKAFSKKIFFFIVTFLLIFCQAFSQKITLSVKNISLDSAFHEIEKYSAFHFVFTSEEVENKPLVSFSLQNAAINEVLEACFKEQPLNYKVEDKFIIVSKKSDDPAATGVNTSAVEIFGRVINDQGEVLIGATVQIKGTQQITKTDGKGGFLLKIQFDSAVMLVVTNIGYETQTLTAYRNRFLTVRLHISASKLDEVQVIGYGTTTKRLNTGSMSNLRASAIEEQPVSNLLEAMEGRAPGIFISQQTGVAGGGFTVQLRGLNSIAQGNDPLYIIDGVPFPSVAVDVAAATSTLAGGNPLFNINPSDVESIEILKDADATAIYGSRGANGVILITTKKGKAGKTKISISSYHGSGKVTRMEQLLNTPQYLAMRHEAFSNDSVTPTISNAPDLLEWDTTKYTNWQKRLIGGTSQINDGQLSISGGNENTQFLIGGGYHRETTLFPGNNADEKASLHVSINHATFDQKLRISFSGSFVSNSNNLPGTDITSISLYLPPNTPQLINSGGTLNWPDGFYANPYASVLQQYSENTYNFISSALLNYEIFPGLEFRTSAGFTQLETNQTQISPLTSFDPLFGLSSGDATYSSSSVRTWIIEPQINWHKAFSKNKIDFLLGSTFQQDIRIAQRLVGTNYTSDALLDNIAAAGDINVQNSGYLPYRYNAFFSRITFNRADKYIVNFTARRDGSSRFGPNRQFANFGAVGGGWIFSKENFFTSHFSFLSYGKLRASYGTTGNDQIGDYQYLATYAPTVYNYAGNGGLFPATLFNPDFSWETNKKAEVGIEFGFIKDRILLSADYYQNRSSNQLVGYPLPLITGGSSVQANLPAVVQNTGLEIDLNIIAIKTKIFNWSSQFTLSIPRNKLLSYPGLDQSAYAETYIVGKSLFIRELYHGTGVDPQSGLYTFLDVNKDGMISYPQDLQASKEISQQFYGGFLNSFTYKGFRLDFLFQFVKQTNYNYLLTSASQPGMLGNQPTLVLDRWQKPGDKTNIERFSQDYGVAYNAYADAVYSGDNTIGDASFIRLKNLSLSYQFNFLQSKIFLHCQNLLTITHYAGMDPENGATGLLPPLKIISTGFSITF
jgi:TonB-dependent starch-binding outer membrane protein SusC